MLLSLLLWELKKGDLGFYPSSSINVGVDCVIFIPIYVQVHEL